MTNCLPSLKFARPSVSVQLVSSDSTSRALTLVFVPLLLLQGPIRVHLAELILLDPRRPTRPARSMRWLTFIQAQWLGGTQRIARRAGAGRPPVRRLAGPDISGTPDHGEPAKQGAESGGRGAEDGEAQLDVGPDEELVVEDLLCLLVHLRQRHYDDQLGDCCGACTAVMSQSAWADGGQKLAEGGQLTRRRGPAGCRLIISSSSSSWPF